MGDFSLQLTPTSAVHHRLSACLVPPLSPSCCCAVGAVLLGWMDGGLHFSRALAPPSPLASSIARPPVRARQPAGRESFDAASRATLGSLALQRLQPLLPCCRPRSTQHTRQPFQPAAIVALASTLPPLLGLLNLPEALGKARSFPGTYSLLPYSIYLGNNHPIVAQ